MPPAAAWARSSGVPSRRSSLRPGTVPDRPGRVVRLEYTFDRLFGTKLELAYAALVANVTRRRGQPAHPTGEPDDENSGDLRPGFRRPQRQEQTIASQTAALIEFAGTSDYSVPDEWVIEDDGFTGAELIRPGLERIRDLAAEGAIEAVLIYSPDRLCREYVHQMLLIEEFCRAGVEVLFVQAPRSETPEDRLLLQFQGMFAEYERTQILERSRRGKLHRARQGQINVLSGAPYGYLYVRKSDTGPARYEILEAEAEVVREVYAWYTVDGLSIGAI